MYFILNSTMKKSMMKIIKLIVIASIQFILLYLRAFVFNVDNFGIGDIEFSSSLMTHG